MAMTERRILVVDGNGLISNVDQLSWMIKAIVAQEEREKVARRVRAFSVHRPAAASA
jgi:DNA invertase Pin-like site-specific DNA recombinase